MLVRVTQQLLIYQTYDEPYRSIIQAYNSFIVQGGIGIVPWTGIALFQEAAADKLCQENAQRVDGAAYKDIGFSDESVNGWYDNCASVYGKHVQ